MTKQSMTPERFKEIRLALGYSSREMAEVLEYKDRSSISLFEAGIRIPSPRVSQLMEFLYRERFGDGSTPSE